VRTLAFPFVIFAQAGLVLLHLDLKLGKCFFAGCADVVADAGGVQRAGRQGKIQ